MRKRVFGHIWTAMARIRLRESLLLSTTIITGYYRMYEWRAKAHVILCACAGWSESAPFAHVRRHFFTWRDIMKLCYHFQTVNPMFIFLWNYKSFVSFFAMRMTDEFETTLPVVFMVTRKIFFSNPTSTSTDQTARTRRLIWVFVGRIFKKVRFLTLRHIYFCMAVSKNINYTSFIYHLVQMSDLSLQRAYHAAIIINGIISLEMQTKVISARRNSSYSTTFGSY